MSTAPAHPSSQPAPDSYHLTPCVAARATSTTARAAVHLGSARFPDEKDYKAYLARNGGSSNASTGIVHTTYHFKVAAGALEGALQRMGAMLVRVPCWRLSVIA